jgi:hypothetical protein
VSCARPSSTPPRPQRHGRPRSASTRASAKRGEAPWRQAGHSSHSSPALARGHETSPAWTSRLRRDPVGLHRWPATASSDRGHRRIPDPCTARPAAPDRAADRTPAPSSGGRFVNCRTRAPVGSVIPGHYCV